MRILRVFHAIRRHRRIQGFSTLLRAFNNLNLRSKITLLLAPLVVILLLFSLLRIAERLRVYEEMNTLHKATGVVILSSSLAHELQKERGLSMGFIASNGGRFSGELAVQRRVVDNRLSVLRLFLKDVELQKESSIYISTDRSIQRLANLGEIRKSIDSQDAASAEILKYFADIVDSLLKSSAEIALVGRGDTTSLLYAYINLAELKERAGMERAVLNEAFTSGKLTKEARDRLSALTVEEKVFQEYFMTIAPVEDRDLFIKKTSIPPVVETMSIIDAAVQTGNLAAIESGRWWEISARRIDALKEVEDSVIYQMSGRAQDQKGRAWQSVFFYSMVASVIILGTIVFSLVMHFTVVRPILHLSDIMDQIDTHTNAGANVKRSDEIGLLYTHFYDMKTKLRETLDGLEETVRIRTQELKQINNLLSKYLSPQLYQKIFSGHHETIMRQKRVKLTIFFSDIIDFTRITERMDPEDLQYILNSYLDEMSRIAIKHGGTIDKFIGDAMMIFFGDPDFTNDRDHALRAVRMSMEMLDKLRELNEKWAERGTAVNFHIRIGINTGFCNVGNFGSESRMDYTVVGKQVNLASRLEGIAESDQIYVSQSTSALVGDEFLCKFKGEFNLKGIEMPAKAYIVVGPKIAGQRNFQARGRGYNLDLQPDTLDEEERKIVRQNLKKAYLLVASSEEIEKLKVKGRV